LTAPREKLTNDLVATLSIVRQLAAVCLPDAIAASVSGQQFRAFGGSLDNLN